jgi:hypothetical protein
LTIGRKRPGTAPNKHKKGPPITGSPVGYGCLLKAVILFKQSTSDSWMSPNLCSYS